MLCFEQLRVMLVNSRASIDDVFQCQACAMELMIVEMRQTKDTGMHDALVCDD